MMNLLTTLLFLLPPPAQGDPQVVPLYHLEDPFRWSPLDSFGFGLEAIGDIDGDGYSDYLVRNEHNRVSIFSGGDGDFIHEKSSNDINFGIALEGGGDRNGDGISDYFIGSIRSNSISPVYGKVFLFSGADHSLIHTFFNGPGNDSFGRSIDASDDLNGDGINDILIGAPPQSYAAGPDGYVDVYDGSTFQLLARYSQPFLMPNMGHYSAFIGDLDLDGTVDIITSGTNRDIYSTLVLSGATGAILHSFLSFGAGSPEAEGQNPVPLGDINGDGYPEWATGNSYNNSRGQVLVFDGYTGNIINVFEGANDNRSYGFALTTIPDLDGNGIMELLIGDPGGYVSGSGFNDGLIEARDPLSGVVHFQTEGMIPAWDIGAYLAVADDLNGDDRPDIITSTKEGEDYVSVLSITNRPHASVGIGCAPTGPVPSLQVDSTLQPGTSLLFSGTAPPLDTIILHLTEQAEHVTLRSTGCSIFLDSANVIGVPITMTADVNGDFSFLATVPASAAGLSITAQATTSGGGWTNGVVMLFP